MCHGIAEVLTIANLAAIDKDCHVLAKPSLIVENVSAGLRVQTKIIGQHLAHSRAGDLALRAVHVALNVPRKSDGRHGAVYRASTNLFSRSSAASHCAEIPSSH